MQHDLHKAECACGRGHAAQRPAGVPDSALSMGPRLRALTVYLVVFQHVPVERCRQLIADVTGAAVSDGFVHSCLGKAASLLKDVVALIRALMAAAPVAGFDETTLRSGPAGEKKYVHGAFTEAYSAGQVPGEEHSERHGHAFHVEVERNRPPQPGADREQDEAGCGEPSGGAVVPAARSHAARPAKGDCLRRDHADVLQPEQSKICAVPAQ